MKSTYKAVEVSAPGHLRVVERSILEPGAGQVRIRVEACGICHTDAATVTGIYPGSPRCVSRSPVQARGRSTIQHDQPTQRHCCGRAWNLPATILVPDDRRWS
jgi:hypothetical protein